MCIRYFFAVSLITLQFSSLKQRLLFHSFFDYKVLLVPLCRVLWLRIAPKAGVILCLCFLARLLSLWQA